MTTAERPARLHHQSAKLLGPRHGPAGGVDGAQQRPTWEAGVAGGEASGEPERGHQVGGGTAAIA